MHWMKPDRRVIVTIYQPKFMLKIIAIIAFLIPFVGFTQKINKDSSDSPSKKDTVIVLQKDVNTTNSEYTQILEKTNAQLSLWWNPYGVFIAALGILFAILAILAAYLIYRQSKDYKDLLKTSIDEHRAALEKLIGEKNNQFKLLESSLDKTILEYNQKLNSVTDENKAQITEFIRQLENQKEYIDAQTHMYRHAGWDPKDINENYPISPSTNFQARIILNDVMQAFVIYIRVMTNDRKQYWLGFAGNEQNEKMTKYAIEYTYHIPYNTKEVVINENIHSYFKKGFPDLTSIPVYVDTVRLRGSNVDRREIIFSYKIV